VIPADRLGRLDDHRCPFRCHVFRRFLEQLRWDLGLVPGQHRTCEWVDVGRVVDERGGAFDHHASKLFVHTSVLGQHGDPRITAEVHDLLTLGVRLEHDLSLDECKPQRREVHTAVSVERADLQALLSCQEQRQFVGVHPDCITSVVAHVGSLSVCRR